MAIDVKDIKYCQKCGLAANVIAGCTCKGVIDCPECGERVSTRNFDRKKKCCEDCAALPKEGVHVPVD